MKIPRLAAGFFAALLAAEIIPACAQEAGERAAVLDVVQRMFDAMSSRDGKVLAAVTLENAPITIESIGPDGATTLRRTTSSDFAATLGKPGPKYWEGIWAPTVHIRGPIAVVWAPYEFKLDDRPHHCGIDVFDLVKADGAWKVAHILYTSEPAACAELKALSP